MFKQTVSSGLNFHIMLPLSSSSMFSTAGWLLDDPANCMLSIDTETSESFLHFPTCQTSIELTQSDRLEDGVSMNKKLTHNASERDRRKKMNHLYSSLRALLPLADQMKKLSNPSTISRVLRYIPELQQQLKGLIKKRQELLTKMAGQGNQNREEKANNKSAVKSSSSSVVSANTLNEREVSIQISTEKGQKHNSTFSQILNMLEEEGLQLLNASSFESFGGRQFFNLHLQVEGPYRLEHGILREKLIRLLHERREDFRA